jgi:hypothetical protein
MTEKRSARRCLDYPLEMRKNQINGYYLLVLKGIVRGLRDDLLEINDFMLKALDKER